MLSKSSQYCLLPPRLWCWYADDTFVIQREENKQNFLQHINSVDPAIQFTVENNKEDGAIPFLDTIIIPKTGGKLSITVYRKPTHMDQYLQLDSHHHLSAKYSVINALTHRAKTVCSYPELLQKEMEQLRKANTPNGLWTRQRKDLPGHPVGLMMGLMAMASQAVRPVTNEVKTNGHIVILYT